MATPVTNKADSITVELAVPMERDGQPLTHIDLRKPHSGDLRGLNLIKVCEMDFQSGEKLLPRISSLNERELLNMPVENWAPLLTTIAGFFVNTEH